MHRCKFNGAISGAVQCSSCGSCGSLHCTLKPYITVVEDEDGSPTYLVQSQSQPALQYKVDLELYTCNCPSFPSIQFCKHFCATQQLFSPQEISPLTFLELPPTAITAPIMVKTSPALPLPTNHTLLKNLDTFSARLQSNPLWIPSNPDNSHAANDFADLLARFIELSSSDNVLPRKKKVPPNHSTARETAASMSHRSGMPKVKTVQKSGINSIEYGGGKNSGTKAVWATTRVKKASATTSTPSSSIHSIPSLLPYALTSVPTSSYSVPYTPSSSIHFTPSSLPYALSSVPASSYSVPYTLSSIPYAPTFSFTIPYKQT